MHAPHACLLRGYEYSDEYYALSRKFLELCSSPLCLISTDIALAEALGFHGVHLKGNQINFIEYAKRKNLVVFYSAHSLEEMLKADMLGADGITISPIFYTPNKGKPLGVKWLKAVSSNYNFKADIFALGGIISEQEVAQLHECRIDGFASIRYFT